MGNGRKEGRRRVRLTLHPEQHGARQLHAQYGDRLVCVRYRYDEQRRKRFKTVELIVEEKAWAPAAPPGAAEQLVGLRIAAAEVTLRERVKQAGGWWDAQRQVWELRYERAVALGLTGRIVGTRGERSV